MLLFVLEHLAICIHVTYLLMAHKYGHMIHLNHIKVKSLEMRLSLTYRMPLPNFTQIDLN